MLNALSQPDRSLLLQSIGTHKANRKLSPIRVAQLLEKAMSVQTIESIAADLELSEPSTLRRILSLRSIPQALQPLVVWGRQAGYLSFSVAAEISRVQDTAKIQQLATAALERNFSKEETRAILQRSKRSNIGMTEAIDEILTLRPIVEQQHLYMGLIPTCWQNQLRPDDEARAKLRRRLAMLVDPSGILSVACNGDRYSFMLNSNAANNPKVAENLNRDEIDAFVKSLLCDDEVIL